VTSANLSPSFPLIPAPRRKCPWGAQAGIHFNVSLDSHLRGSERSVWVIIHQLTCMTCVRAIITPINIGVVVLRFPKCRMTITMPAKLFLVMWRRIARGRTSTSGLNMNLMFASRLSVFVDNIISHMALHNKEAGLTCEPANGSKKLPYLFSAPTSGFLQIWKMLESSRLQPWRFVFPNVTVNADSHLPPSPYLKRKKFRFCSKRGMDYRKLHAQRMGL